MESEAVMSSPAGSRVSATEKKHEILLPQSFYFPFLGKKTESVGPKIKETAFPFLSQSAGSSEVGGGTKIRNWIPSFLLEK